MEIKLNTVYRHYQGELYRTIYLGVNSETGQPCVICQRLSDQQIVVTPTDLFTETLLDRGQPVDRFQVYNQSSLSD